MSNFPCPECGVTLRHASRSCGCGWGKGSGRAVVASGYDPINAEQTAARAQKESDFSAECRKWLDDHHVTKPGMTQPERMKAMGAYRSMLAKTMRRADLDPKAWASSLKSDYLDGADLLPIQIAMASESMGEVWEKRECRPRNAVAE
jgi:hypothetical protein